MTGKPISREKRDMAKAYALEDVRSGCNCAEGTIRGLIRAEIIDMPLDLGNRLSCGFGGGGGGAGNSCGALCGGLLAVNWAFGRDDPFAIEDLLERRRQLVEYVYVYANNYTKRFVDTNGTALCKDVITRNGTYGSEAQAKDCAGIIFSAIEHVCDMLQLQDEDIPGLPKGFTVTSIGQEAAAT